MRVEPRNLQLLGGALSAALLLGVLLATSGAVSAQPGKPPKAGCDQDGDGHQAVACGGDDCDDADGQRYPGNPERCAGALVDGRATADHDEDCNPCTVARLDGDQDHDLVTASTCSNPWASAGLSPVGCDLHATRVDTQGQRVLGADCDDANRAIIPGEMVCPDGMPGVIRICAPTGMVGTSPPSHWDTRKCVGKCVPQVNGTGICIP